MTTWTIKLRNAAFYAVVIGMMATMITVIKTWLFGAMVFVSLAFWVSLFSYLQSKRERADNVKLLSK